MSICQYLLWGTEFNKNAVYFAYIAPLVAPCVKLSVAERSGSALPKAIIRVCVEKPLSAYVCNVNLTAARNRTSVNDYRFYAVFKQSERRIKPSRS